MIQTYHFKKYLPEILTGVGIGGEVLSNALFVRAAKLEEKDGKKTHYILPLLVSAGSIAAIVGSNRVSNSQKASIVAAGGLLLSKCMAERKEIKEKYGNDEVLDLDLNQLKILADRENEIPFIEDETKELYYMPDYGIIFYANPGRVMTAELNLNESFTHDGEAFLSEFFAFLGLKNTEMEAAGLSYEQIQQVADNIGWRFNWEDYDNGIQYITFNNYQKVIHWNEKDIPCNFIYIEEEALPMYQWNLRYEDVEDAKEDYWPPLDKEVTGDK